MVRRMSVYDLNGHRVRTKSSGGDDDSGKLELPPISGDGSRVGSGSQRGSRSGSQRNSASSTTGSRKAVDAPNDPNRLVPGKDIIGVLYRGFLSRRRLDSNGSVNPVNDNMVYLPQLRSHPSGSVRTSRSEPLHIGRRLVFEKSFANNRSPHRGRNLKEFATDRVITIVERSDRRHPAPGASLDARRRMGGYECHCVVSESRFRDINDFVDELSRVLNAPERDRYLFSLRYGNIVRTLSELEDGGEYFFGPPNGDFRVPPASDLSTPDLIDDRSDPTTAEGEDEKRSAGSRVSGTSSIKQWGRSKDTVGGLRKRKVVMMTNYAGTNGSISFVVDEARHKTISDLCHDVGSTLGFTRQGYSSVERICTRSGRTCTTVNDILVHADDTFIAVTTHDPYMHPHSGYLGEDPYYQRGYFGYNKHPPVHQPVRHQQPRFSGRDRTWRQPFEVAINGKVHVFEPPSIDYHDPLSRRNDSAPLQSLDIDWIYGYNGKNCRNNLCLLPSLELVYFVAKSVIILEPDEGKQRFYTEHTDEIRCLAQHPGSWIIATGQVSGGGDKGFQHVRVWDAKTTVTLNVLRYDVMDMSVECLSFSQDDNGMKLVGIANSTDEWKLQVWDWEESLIVSKSNPYTDIELVCAFDPLDSNIVISCGKSHVYFWDTSTALAHFAPGRFYDYQVPDFVTCLGFNENSELITADSNGYLHKWLSDERKTYSIIKTSHTSSIITMEVLQGDYVVTGGGSDRMLCLTNCDNEEAEPTIGKVEIGENYGGIIAIAPVKNDFVGNDFENMKLVLGTSMNTILCGTPADGDFECVVSGPSDELSALKAHPSENIFIVCGTDSYVTLCSGETRKEIWEVKLDSPCTAVDFSPDGKKVCVGCTDGNWVELNTEDGHQHGSYQTESSQVRSIRYSPDGQMVAVGLETGAIYWYQCPEDASAFRYVSSVKVLTEPIVSMDWSQTGSHIRFATSSFDYEIWNMEKRRIEGNEMVLRDLQFAGESCALHYYTAGIWNNPERDVTFPVCTISSNNLFCVGTNTGGIRVYNYPVDANMVPYNEGDAHSTQVSSVSFLSGDEFFLSSGRNDYSIVQWKVQQKDPSKEPLPPHDRRIRQASAGYYSEWQRGPRYGDYDPVPPPPRPVALTASSGRRPGPARRASIFQHEYVAKHGE